MTFPHFRDCVLVLCNELLQTLPDSRDKSTYGDTGGSCGGAVLTSTGTFDVRFNFRRVGRGTVLAGPTRVRRKKSTSICSESIRKNDANGSSAKSFEGFQPSFVNPRESSLPAWVVSCVWSVVLLGEHQANSRTKTNTFKNEEG